MNKEEKKDKCIQAILELIENESDIAEETTLSGIARHNAILHSIKSYKEELDEHKDLFEKLLRKRIEFTDKVKTSCNPVLAPVVIAAAPLLVPLAEKGVEKVKEELEKREML